MAKRKKTTATELPKEVIQKEQGEWKFSFMSSKWFVLLVLLLAGIIWYGFYSTHTKVIAGSDDRGYAEIARNIAHGKGIVRNFAYPVDINFFNKLPIPEFFHPPGYPVIIAGFFKLFGISDFAALLPSYLSYFILMILVFLFAKRYLEIQTATLAVLILIFNKDILDPSTVAISEGVYTLFFFLFFFFFIRARSLSGVFLSGIILGMSNLIRENLYPFLIPTLVYLYFYPDLPRWKKMTFFIVGVLIPVVPNMIRSVLATGSPQFSYGKFGLMAFTPKYPWLSIYRNIQNPSFLEFLVNEPGQFFVKYLSNLVAALERVISVSNPYLLAFCAVEMFYWKISPEWKRIKMLFIFLLLSQILFISLITFAVRFFTPFLPLMAVLAAQGFLRMAEQSLSGLKPSWKKGIFALNVVLFFIFFVMPTTYSIIRPTQTLNSKTLQFGFLMPRDEAKRLNEFVSAELKENQVIWTDVPEVLEWEGDRLCGWLPNRIESIYEIHRRIPVDALLLTNLRTPYEMGEEWKYLLFSDQSLPLYRNVKFYNGGVLVAKLLIRDERE
jgi:4-amino-4-deoxy-L-arabinose transferase-like glycosyltransferase